MVDFYKKTLQGESIIEVDKMRKTLLYSNIESNFGVDANYWFKQMTDKINILKKIEDNLSRL